MAPGRQSTRTSMQEFAETFSETTKSIVSSVSASLKSYSESASKYYTEKVVITRKLKKSGYWEQRDLYPRMGWHDVQAAVSGRVARDIASHFVQVRK